MTWRATPGLAAGTQRESKLTVTASEGDAKVGRRRLIVLIPLVVFLGLAVLFMIRLGAGDPSSIPSALIGHPAPQTALPPLPGLARDGTPVPGLDPAAFAGQVSILHRSMADSSRWSAGS